MSLLDDEILQQLVQEGFPLVPGAAGENLTVAGLDVQQMHPGTVLKIGDAVLQLEQPRKPCYVLDAIDPRLKDAIRRPLRLHGLGSPRGMDSTGHAN